MFWIQMLLAFIVGILFNKLWGGLLSLGYSILLIKQVQDDSVKIMGAITQGLVEVQQIKLIELHRAGKSKEEIEIEQNVSEYRLKSLQDAIIKNFINKFPNTYSNILKFYDWDSAMQYLDELITKEKNSRSP